MTHRWHDIKYRNWRPIATIEGIPPRTLRRWCVKGLVRAQKIGKQWFVHLPSLARLFASPEED